MTSSAQELQKEVTRAYKEYVQSFIKILDPRIRALVHEKVLEGERLWPAPLVQLNPAYEMGRTLEELVRDEGLHENVAKFFTDRSGKPLHLYLHQDEAITRVLNGRSIVVTSGTGSGKTLTYFVPIFDHIWKSSPKNVCAIVIYPTNALVNSQRTWLEEACERARANGLTGVEPERLFRRYTGQESDDEKAAIQKNPPAILLTNYMMLELMLLRPKEQAFFSEALRYIVVDELHTFRGRVGADMALLMRRIRARARSKALTYIGTSATVASGDTPLERRRATAEFGTLLFGTPVQPDDVVEESLRPWARADLPPATADELRQAALKLAAADPPADRDAFETDPLVRWFQDTMALQREELEDGSVRYRRHKPRSLQDAVSELVRQAGVDEATAATVVDKLLNWTVVRSAEVGGAEDMPALKLHQFFCQGSPVYATLEPKEQREIRFEGGYYASSTDETGERKVLYPLAFCRHCGQEYYRVEYDKSQQGLRPDPEQFLRFVPPAKDEGEEEDAEVERGYVAIGVEWGGEPGDLYPEEWLDDNGRVKSTYRDRVPRTVWVTPTGQVHATEDDCPGAIAALYQPGPLSLCVSCGEAYTRNTGEYTKLTTLSAEGRSTTSSLVALYSIWKLRELDPTDEGRKQAKVLIFADNRQDAALQAGHFNDLVARLQLRCALYKAVREKGEVHYEDVANEVVRALALRPADYARNPDVEEGTKGYQRTQAALREMVRYRILEDLQREGRVVLPTLEECGLVRIRYEGLEEAARDPRWGNTEWFGALTPEKRADIFEALLDELRLRLAVDAPVLCETDQRHRLKDTAAQYLNEYWGFEQDEEVEEAAVAVTEPRRNRGRVPPTISLTSRGRILRWMAREIGCAPGELADELPHALEILVSHGLLTRQRGGYRLSAGCLVWVQGDGKPFVRRVRSLRAEGETYGAVRSEAEELKKANELFESLYTRGPQDYRLLRAAEHTAQIPSHIREDRERQFREGDLPVLCCSPTMELGIDISELSVVMHRNVPPTPANYAQRAGRAGRAGQPAVIFTYCSQASPHDQYFFRHRADMVGGIVKKPQIDVSNEDLVRSHVCAICLGCTGADLGQPMKEIVDITAEGYPLRPEVRQQLNRAATDPEKRRQVLDEISKVLDSLIEAAPSARDKLERLRNEADENFIAAAAGALDRQFDYWRTAYRTLCEKADVAHKVLTSGVVTGTEFSTVDEARIVQATIHEQLKNLRGEPTSSSSETDEQSIFYPYRFLAGQMFLPGYGFPRKPVLAFLRNAHGQEGRFLSRSPVLAATEFGPLNILYYDGRRFEMRYLQPMWSAGRVETSFRICPSCGFIYPHEEGLEDVCEYCGTSLSEGQKKHYVEHAVRMECVLADYRRRVTCAEEERRRLGYNVEKCFRWGEGRRDTDHEKVDVRDASGRPLMTLCYLPSARIYALNRGFRKSRYSGFYMIADNGRWLSRHAYERQARDDHSLRQRVKEGVVPFVIEHSNALMMELHDPLFQLANGKGRDLTEGQQFAATLVHALLCGIIGEFQVEESEVSADRRSTRYAWFYETAEGGLGVLKELVLDERALRAVARAALEALHFDPDTGEDIKREECAAACYQCLLSYYNQMEHRFLDRFVVRDALTTLMREAQVETLYQVEERYRLLRDQVDRRSELEQKLLDYLYRHGYRLPHEAQKTIRLSNGEKVSCDFFYRGAPGAPTCVFCDGPPHDEPQKKAADERIRRLLEEYGYHVVVIRYDRDLGEQVREHPEVFGTGSGMSRNEA